MSYHHALEKGVDRANPDPIIQPSSHLYRRKQDGEGVQRDYLDYLVSQGFPVAREERLTEESLVFALPPELRKDLRRGANRE